MVSMSRLVHLRARLELPVLKKATGLLDGRHRSIYTGHGQDFDDMIEYRPGDDISDIDWKASARAGHPIIKRFQRETNLSLILAVDTGHSMATLAPSGETKAEVAIFAAEVIAFLARHRGDLVGLVSGDSERIRQVPARQGTEHLETLLRRLAMDMSREGPPSALTRVLQRVFAGVARRSLVVVITDEARPELGAEPDLRRLRTRHEVMVIAIADLRPTEMTGRGGVIVDVDGGELPDFVRRDPQIRSEAGMAVERRKAEVRAMLQRRGITSVVVRGTEDAVDALVDLLGRQRRVRH
ncbi:MAG TPA: DUF58 domain-containing protein [Actinomycetaceae bacterium]|nr:DUF58 domain-containing protein [Actinomycetaceae bacterium]